MENYVVCEIMFRQNKFANTIDQMKMTTKLLKNSKNIEWLIIIYKIINHLFSVFFIHCIVLDFQY